MGLSLSLSPSPARSPLIPAKSCYRTHLVAHNATTGCPCQSSSSLATASVPNLSSSSLFSSRNDKPKPTSWTPTSHCYSSQTHGHACGSFKRAKTLADGPKSENQNTEIDMSDGGGFHTRALTSVADHDGILDEILARLPVKSLMRFRCVCKSWRALIADSYFATKHFRYANQGITDNTSRLFISMYPPRSIDHEALKDMMDDGDCDFAIRKYDCPVMFPKSAVNQIVGSCNGLICVQIDREEIVLWNPSTRDYKVLPKPSIHCTSDFYGFGHDSTSDDYKVMLGSYIEVGDSEKAVIQIFSSKSGSWSNHNDLHYRCYQRGCLLNGALHWFGYEQTDLLSPSWKLMSFDLREEKFQGRIPLPNDVCLSNIFIAKNCLCIYSSRNVATTGFRIWMLEGYGVKECWTKIISSKSLPQEFKHACLTPLCILENDELLMVANCTVKLILYSSKEMTFRNGISRPWLFNGTIFRETLVSPVTSSVADI